MVCAVWLVFSALSLRAQTMLGPLIDEEVVSAGLTAPMGVSFLPDGRMIVAQRNGGIQVVVGGTPVSMGTVQGPLVVSELGLYCVATDPQWPARPYLYTVYTSQSPDVIRLSMLEVQGSLSDPLSTNLVLGNEFILVEFPNQDSIHQGGKVRFGPLGFLWMTIGDDNQQCLAMDETAPQGKVLRLDVSAFPAPGATYPPAPAQLAAPGNPFVGGGYAPLVYAAGFRNPYTLAVDPITGTAFVGDVGWYSREEITHITAPGQNHGWPTREGDIQAPPASWNQSCPGPLGAGPFVDPLVAYDHSQGRSVICLGIYRNQGGRFDWGPDFEGDVLYTDFYETEIRRLDWDGASFSAPQVLGSSLNTVTDARIGPDGALYYARGPFGQGAVRRIRRAFVPEATSIGVAQISASGQPLTLSAPTLPAIGNLLFRLEVSGAQPSGSVALFLAGDTQPSPLVLGPSITMHLELNSALAFLASGFSPWPVAIDVQGAGLIPAPLANDPALLGVRFGLQALAVEPGGAVSSNALRLTFGE